MKSINPYLIFNGNAEEAFSYYQSVFGGKLTLIRFRDMPDSDKMSGDDQNKVAHASLPIADGHQKLMASDSTSGNEVEIPPNGNFYITVAPENADQAEEIYQKLSQDGQVIMPLQNTSWAKQFAMFSDKFGVRWMIDYE